jgi:hypothetical protein
MGSQRTTGRRSKRKAAADCRHGIHRFGSPKLIGGGMSRQTCSVCGAISIDIRQPGDEAAAASDPSHRGGHRR